MQLVLDNVSIVNEDAAAIYVLSADKAFITLTGENTLTVSGLRNEEHGFRRHFQVDLTLNGTGSLTVVSTKATASPQGRLKITAALRRHASSDGLKANDSIRICGGTITIVPRRTRCTAENDKDAPWGTSISVTAP